MPLYAHTQQITKLKNYFIKRDDVVMAFLFGSRAKKLGTPRSDWDVGVYIKPKNNAIEWETRKKYPQTDEIWGDIIKILKTDNVDLITLNSAPANIADSVIKGFPLVIKDRTTYLKFLLPTIDAAIDYRALADDYYTVFDRSKSLSAEDKLILKKRLMFLENELADLPLFKNLTQREYIENRQSKRSVERWVENIINASLDITKTLLASKRKQIPETYREILWSLQLLPGFSAELSEQFAGWASLRNILSHEYLDLRWKEINGFIRVCEPFMNEFIKGVKGLM